MEIREILAFHTQYKVHYSIPEEMNEMPTTLLLSLTNLIVFLHQ
jgi:hypothetical protein